MQARYSNRSDISSSSSCVGQRTSTDVDVTMTMPSASRDRRFASGGKRSQDTNSGHDSGAPAPAPAPTDVVDEGESVTVAAAVGCSVQALNMSFMLDSGNGKLSQCLYLGSADNYMSVFNAVRFFFANRVAWPPDQVSQGDPKAARANPGAQANQIEPTRAIQGAQGSQIEPARASQGA